jgi:hypothetical protein
MQLGFAALFVTPCLKKNDVVGDQFIFDEPFIDGMVHAYVDQKLLKSNKIKSFNR